ncbi:hypothetical protein [Halococcus salsus]|uniref:hypothetical protein n=1 Tax=Halococcus salsus TaxID=2162894 RepID=UPI00135C4308|nr:hypothetical protein [Halococcus salsus]
MANFVDRLPLPRLYLQSGMMVLGGLVVALIGVLFLIAGESSWWVMFAVGGISVFSGAVTYYQNDPVEYSTGDVWLVLGVAAVILELALLALVAYPMI